MPYSYKNAKGQTYYLNQRGPAGKTGKGKLFFFSKNQSNETVDNLPEGYTIIENAKTGLPILKRKEPK